jgi:hypothetical protein
VVLFEGARVRGVERLELLTIVALRYDEVALRRVQNVPAVVGIGLGSVIFENAEFER